MKKIIWPVYIAIFSALITACGNPNQRLDEYIFYDGPQFRLKVVRYYRNIPFNQLGEQAVVMCQSENTTEFPSYEQQDAGWHMLGAGDVQGSKTAKEAALRIKHDYEVFDDHTLIVKMSIFNISFDACGHFINWDPGRLPQALINPREKPDSCAPDGPVDCRHYDFEEEGAPHYEQIQVAGNGQVSFTASTPTFKGVESLYIETRNNGDVWHVETVGSGKQQLKPDALRSLPVSALENGLEDVSLEDWFEAVLPARSMVIWPDILTSCGKQRCAEIRFNDSEGNSGTLYIAMHTDSAGIPGEVSFHSSVYNTGQTSRPIKSLASLRESLVSSTK